MTLATETKSRQNNSPAENFLLVTLPFSVVGSVGLREAQIKSLSRPTKPTRSPFFFGKSAEKGMTRRREHIIRQPENPGSWNW